MSTEGVELEVGPEQDEPSGVPGVKVGAPGAQVGEVVDVVRHALHTDPGVAGESADARPQITFNPKDIARVVDLLAEAYPLGSPFADKIAGPYLRFRDVGVTNDGLDLMLSAITSQVGTVGLLNFQHQILSAYIERIGYEL